MKSSLITLVVLVILTILSAVVSNYVTNYATTIILILAGLKFMDLIKAHIFWRIIIAAFVFVILTIILVIY